MPPELMSRFDTKLYLRPYSPEEFVSICKGYLPKQEDIPDDLASYIGRETWQQLDKDIRTARGAARRLREMSTTDVDRVIRFLRKYGKVTSNR